MIICHIFIFCHYRDKVDNKQPTTCSQCYQTYAGTLQDHLASQLHKVRIVFEIKSLVSLRCCTKQLAHLLQQMLSNLHWNSARSPSITVTQGKDSIWNKVTGLRCCTKQLAHLYWCSGAWLNSWGPPIASCRAFLPRHVEYLYVITSYEWSPLCACPAWT